MQLIFRKVADVRREKELAERRKNEPQLDSNQDQLVRKIFSKFRRDRSTLQPQYSITDVEKGGTHETKAGTITVKSETVTDVAANSIAVSSSVTTSSLGLNNKVSRPTTKSRWGRFSSSSMSDSVKSDSYLARPTVQEMTGSNKVFPKLQNTSSSDVGISRGIQRQDTIEEGIEIVMRPVKSSVEHEISELTEPNLKKSETPSLTRRLSQFQPCSNDFKDMQSTLSEFKTDTSKELQHMNQRMERLEVMLHELINKVENRNVLMVNTEQQTDSPFTQLISPISDRDSASTATESHQISVLSNIIPRKRRSKARTKGTAPSIPYRSIPQRSRQVLRDSETQEISPTPFTSVGQSVKTSDEHVQPSSPSDFL